MGDRALLAELPGYLCPALGLSATRSHHSPGQVPLIFPSRQRRCLHVESTGVDPDPRLEPSPDEALAAKKLPLQCHGCGAFTQTSQPDQAGFYDLNRKAVRKFLGLGEQSENSEKVLEEKDQEDFVVDQALQTLGPEKLEELGIDPNTLHYGEEAESHMTCESPNFYPVPVYLLNERTAAADEAH